MTEEKKYRIVGYFINDRHNWQYIEVEECTLQEAKNWLNDKSKRLTSWNIENEKDGEFKLKKISRSIFSGRIDNIFIFEIETK